jgi:hypothetical protein
MQEITPTVIYCPCELIHPILHLTHGTACLLKIEFTDFPLHRQWQLFSIQVAEIERICSSFIFDLERTQPKLHETGKRYEVSETGTIRNMPSKNGNAGGNTVYIYIVLKKIKHYIGRKT